MNHAFKAMMFARHIHRTQVRRYTNTPYFEHLAEVVGIVSTSCQNAIVTVDVMTSVAWLHDCVEDQDVSMHELHREFGQEIATGVILLSDMESGNRASRKRQSRERLAVAPGWIQTIKYADLISNAPSIFAHDPAFAATYLEEARLLLDVMKDGDALLRQYAMKQITTTQKYKST